MDFQFGKTLNTLQRVLETNWLSNQSWILALLALEELEIDKLHFRLRNFCANSPFNPQHKKPNYTIEFFQRKCRDCNFEYFIIIVNLSTYQAKKGIFLRKILFFKLKLNLITSFFTVKRSG